MPLAATSQLVSGTHWVFRRWHSAKEAINTPVQALVWRHLLFPVSRGTCFGGQVRGWGCNMAGGPCAVERWRSCFRAPEGTLLLGSNKQLCMCESQTLCTLYGRLPSAQSFLLTTDKKPRSLHPGTWGPATGEQGGTAELLLCVPNFCAANYLWSGHWAHVQLLRT